MNSNSIDIESRRKAAEIYRHFASGTLTNDEMEDALPGSFEDGLHEIFFCGIWPLYDDMHEHKLTGRYRLNDEGRKHVARIILFLHSTLPYRWPSTTGWMRLPDFIISIFTLGYVQLGRRRFRVSSGDEAVWPFFDRSEYELALQSPPYLKDEIR